MNKFEIYSDFELFHNRSIEATKKISKPSDTSLNSNYTMPKTTKNASATGQRSGSSSKKLVQQTSIPKWNSLKTNERERSSSNPKGSKNYFNKENGKSASMSNRGGNSESRQYTIENQTKIEADIIRKIKQKEINTRLDDYSKQAAPRSVVNQLVSPTNKSKKEENYNVYDLYKSINSQPVQLQQSRDFERNRSKDKISRQNTQSSKNNLTSLQHKGLINDPMEPYLEYKNNYNNAKVDRYGSGIHSSQNIDTYNKYEIIEERKGNRNYGITDSKSPSNYISTNFTLSNQSNINNKYNVNFPEPNERLKILYNEKIKLAKQTIEDFKKKKQDLEDQILNLINTSEYKKISMIEQEIKHYQNLTQSCKESTSQLNKEISQLRNELGKYNVKFEKLKNK